MIVHVTDSLVNENHIIINDDNLVEETHNDVVHNNRHLLEDPTRSSSNPPGH